jgi:DNA primase large subunit
LPNLINTTVEIFLSIFIKVDFTEVVDLVKQRKVFVKAGFAYVTISDFNSILTHIFRAKLSLNLTV